MIKKIFRKVAIYLCTCERCGFEWESLTAELKRCRECRTPLWNIPKPAGPKGELQTGRPAVNKKKKAKGETK